LEQISIKNKHLTLNVLNYGAIIQHLWVNDRNGRPTNIVVGHDDPQAYLQDPFFLGACIGRYAGRISNGGFTLEGKRYDLYTKEGVHLHGGKEGFDKKYWRVVEVHHGEHPFVTLSHTSEHLEEGYPGTLTARVTYKLVGNALQILHSAVTDRTTVVNLTNHSYFQLDAEPGIAHYNLRLNSKGIQEMDQQLLPSGRIAPVNGTPYDFLEEKKINGMRLDTAFVLDGHIKEATYVSSPVSGISMKVITDQPAVIVYTPPGFPAICFETENYADAPNHPEFPSSVLRPGEEYSNGSTFQFGTL
jgi:aldose 1-epimerase